MSAAHRHRSITKKGKAKMGADRITNGPPNSNLQNPMDTEALVLDQRDSQLYVSGLSRQLKVLHKAIQVVPRTATPSTPFLTQVFNPGALNVLNRIVRLRGRFGVGTNTTGTFTLNLIFGGQVLCSLAVTYTAGTTNPADFEFVLHTTAVGAAGTMLCNGFIATPLGAPGTPATIMQDTNINSSPAINLLTAQTLTLTGTIPGSGSVLTYAMLELLH